MVNPLFPEENRAEGNSHYLIQRNGPPQSDDIPVEYPAGQAAQHDPHQPDPSEGNDHRGVLMARRPDGAVKNFGQILRDLGKAHNKYILHADFDQVLFIVSRPIQNRGQKNSTAQVKMLMVIEIRISCLKYILYSASSRWPMALGRQCSRSGDKAD